MNNNFINLHKNFIKTDNRSDNILLKNKENISGKKNNDTLIKAIIQPLKIEKGNKYEITKKYETITKNFDQDAKKLREGRTNLPYKNILKDQDYKKKINEHKDLIVYKVNEKDKNEQILDKEYNNHKNNIEVHEKELKIIYSLSSETEHLKKFLYKNKVVYTEKYNPKKYKDLKDDNIEYFKKEQEEIEKNKKEKDEIINLVNSGYFQNIDKGSEINDFYEVNDKVNDKVNKYKDRQKKTIIQI
jgi:hypothetical protein